MVLLSGMFFMSVLAVSLWAMFVTIAPRIDYIAALLSGAVVAPVMVPVAQRRRVRQLNPLSVRSEIRMIRAAA